MMMMKKRKKQGRCHPEELRDSAPYPGESYEQWTPNNVQWTGHMQISTSSTNLQHYTTKSMPISSILGGLMMPPSWTLSLCQKIKNLKRRKIKRLPQMCLILDENSVMLFYHQPVPSPSQGYQCHNLLLQLLLLLLRQLIPTILQRKSRHRKLSHAGWRSEV